ncbi:hypothetical protein LQ318_01530 [Aliifodinibius salicampi]|uniref:Uncharacterized protein n=1 Tax=Fodinibius salicampi TaxID=1920655 RepID=A0ABT3PUQ0_9BACT|nr:hypothetical protein [Fodinibius salicampi]MCW9711572.1 hypothetical protein [Fodinibius salicampi]
MKEQPNQEIQNLVAFARLYGHIKYFHPSDEASAIDWNKFAIHGVKEVKGAANRDELKEALNSLFLPIAPTVRIRQKELADSPFISSYLNQLDYDTTKLQPVAWQHLGVSLQSPGIVYNSIRVNRLLEDMFGLRHNVDPQQVAGKKLRLRAALKTTFKSEDSEVQVSIEVEQGQGHDWSQSISSTVENASTPGYSPDKWRIIEVESNVKKRLEEAAIEISLYGPGTLWIDDVTLSAQMADGNWEPVSLPNAGFEEQYLHSNDQKLFTDPLAGWMIVNARKWSRMKGVHNSSPTHTWLASGNNYGAVTDEASFSGKQSYRIELPTRLFDKHPEVGKTAKREIAPGLYSEVPLALYRDDEHTLPPGNTERFEQLNSHLNAVNTDSATADDVNVRLADVIIAWNVFQHFYPYFDVVHTDWEQQLIRTLQGALTDKTEEDFYLTLSKMLVSLQDGHIWLTHPSQDKPAALPFIVDWIDDKGVVTHSQHTSIKPGDIILTLDKVPAGDIVQSQMELISGSSQHSRYRSLRLFGTGKPDTKAKVEVKQGNGISIYSVLRIDRESADEMEWSHLPVIDKI